MALTLYGQNFAERSAQLLDSARLHDLLTQMRTRMDVIIIDTPPMSAGGDAERIADLADAAILVVRQDQAPVRALNDCIDVLRRSDAEVLGCVFNNVYAASVSDRQSYGYGYGYGYGHGYGYGTQTEEDA